MTVNIEVAKLYHSHQYGRAAILEERRTEFTNIVVGSSAIALAILSGTEVSESLWGALVVTLVVAVANLLAIGHTIRVGQQVSAHIERGRTVLAAMSPDLAKLNRAISTDSDRWWHSSRRYQLFLHVTFVFAAALSVAGRL